MSEDLASQSTSSSSVSTELSGGPLTLSKLEPTMTAEIFTLDNGLSWTTNPIGPKVNKISVIGIICTKETWSDRGLKEETELIKCITTNQHNKYKLVSTSVKDPKSLRTNLSIHDTFKNLEQQLVLNKRLAHTLSNPLFKRSQLLITSPGNSFSPVSAKLIWALAKNT